MGRLEKVNQQLKREIAHILQSELSDPRLEFVSITRVTVSPDLRHAKVYFSVLGDSKKILLAQHGLQSARGIIRRLVGQGVKMRFTPELAFFHDDALEFNSQIEETLQEINNETRENPSDDQGQ